MKSIFLYDNCTYFRNQFLVLEEDEEEVMSQKTNTGDIPIAAMVIEPPRQTRQNPNLSRQKTLVTENIDKLRMGL